MAGTHAGGLLRRSGRFYYRRRVPADLVRALGKREVKLSLRTSIRFEARSRAVMLAARVEGVFMALRDEEERRLIERLVGEYERRLIEEDRDERVFGGAMLPHDEEPADFYLSQIADVAERLVKRDWRGVESEAQELLSRFGSDLSPAGLQRLCYALQAALIRVLKQCADERDAASRGERLVSERAASPVVAQPAAALDGGTGGPLLGEAIAKLVEQSRGVRWTAKTAHMIETGLRDFVGLVSDKPLADVSRDDVQRYRAHLAAKPGRGGQRLSAGSVNKLLAGVGRLFAFARDQGWHVQPNAVTGMKLPKGKAREQRLPFTEEELRALFGKEFEAATLGDSQPARYWVPLIAAFSGARLEEVAQLRCQDFAVEDGVQVFQVRSGEGRRVKNASSERSVPVHPKLVALGLLDFVQRRRAGTTAELFPELKSKALNGKGDAVSKWFTRWRKSVGVTDSKKTFHSLRHTVQNRLAQVGVEERLIADLVGHETATMTGGRYIKNAPIQQLAEALRKLELPLGFAGE